MPSTTIASGTFPSRSAANQAIHRLVSNGFARNSIELHPHEDDEGYDLEVHTRRENVRRVRRLMNAPTSMDDVRQVATGAVHTARAHPFILLGASALAGFAIYNLILRNGEPSGRQQRSGRHAARRR